MEVAPEAVIADATVHAPDLTPRQRKRAVIAASTGNALEFYDFITFAFFAIQIGNTFFPSKSAFVSLMAALATFGAGFITRPIGAFVLGGYADKHGRKPAMLISMTMMGTGIALLALTPGYAQIGVIAPVIAVLARMIQGFALGGEVGSATVYMMESATDARRGFSISWQGASQQIAASTGALVGLGLSLMLTAPQLTAFGWRIALLLGVSIVPFALYIRRSLPETIEIAKQEELPAAVAKSFWRPIICGFIAIASGTIATYIFQYMATFGQNSLGLSATISMAGEFANNGVGIFAILIGGIASDLYGRRPIMIAAQGAFCLLIVPCFLWLMAGRNATSFIGANLVLSAASSAGYGAVYAAISESLPPAVRARVFALVYSLPVCIFGGTTQLVVTWILHVTGSPMALAWYLTGVSAIGVVAMAMMRESAPVRITRPTAALA